MQRTFNPRIVGSSPTEHTKFLSRVSVAVKHTRLSSVETMGSNPIHGTNSRGCNETVCNNLSIAHRFKVDSEDISKDGLQACVIIL